MTPSELLAGIAAIVYVIGAAWVLWLVKHAPERRE